jgi:hypothetical protein
MNTKRTARLAVAMALFAGLAVAGPRQSIRLDVDSSATLAGKTIPAGSYKLSWQGDGDAVKVTVAQGKTVVAEAQGRFVDGGSKAASDGLVWQRQGAESTLTKIVFGGSTRVLVLAGS